MKLTEPEEGKNCKTLIINKFVLLAAILSMVLLSRAAQSQERIVDDAAITVARSFQIETWYGQHESEFVPAVGWNSWLETSLGFMFNSPQGMRLDGFMLEAKVVNTDYETKRQALGLVLGSIYEADFTFSEWYFYIPYSRLILYDTSVLHLNAGLNYHRYMEEKESTGITYGGRVDWGVHSRLDLLTGIFAENTQMSFYLGLRIHIIPDLLEILPTYGQRFLRGHPFPGWSFQITLTPQQLW